jgi:hypothetical protein
MNDDEDAPQQTTLWEFEPDERPEIFKKFQAFLGL